MQNKPDIEDDKQNREQLLPALSVIHSACGVSQGCCRLKEQLLLQVVRKSDSRLGCTCRALHTKLMLGRSTCLLFSRAEHHGQHSKGWTSSKEGFSFIPIAFT